MHSKKTPHQQKSQAKPSPCEYTLFGRKLANPFILASGMVQNTCDDWVRIAESTPISVVTTKSITLTKRSGNPHPRIYHFQQGMLNAVGIPSLGLDALIPELERFKSSAPKELAISLYATEAEEFLMLARAFDHLQAIYFELNLSCPNISQNNGVPLAADPQTVKTIIAQLKMAGITTPVVAKLSPQTPNIVQIAEGALQEVVDGFTLTNTIPAMLFDHQTQRPVLGFGSGGMSGPALHPIAVKAVYDVRQVSAEIPIIGTGGIYTAEDALTMHLAGASFFGIGSVIYKKGMKAIKTIVDAYLQNFDGNAAVIQKNNSDLL